ncbi:ChbG/HpnK family deacetylase [Nitrincola sp. A-D6]|uniref:ChbG/HpnK family deacetylase n=1 Tax=Nitrincola sp. A-D6 TaxID=1545442 RepID=UPI00068FDE57|nr:ChbG/HpnK family deacetylase [Nitrincola sp. A-D6]
MKSVVLCADDFGLSAEINEGILQLLECQRLSAVSCMTCLPYWNSSALTLNTLRSRAAIGLHFNLTESPRAVSLGHLMQQSLTGRLDHQWVRDELQRQLDDFENVLGCRPDFVDGHQHVQVFPGIRQVLIEVLQTRYTDQQPWVRRVAPHLTGHDALVKALVLRLMSTGFATQMRRQQLPLTQAFAGLYSLNPNADFASLLHGWINQLPDGGLIMCHPGATGKSVTGLALTRQRELAYLSGDSFLSRLQQQAVNLTATPTLY